MNTVTELSIEEIRDEMTQAAKSAAQRFVDDWTRQTGGNQYGEPMYCGFAWVTIVPEHRKNSNAGRAERKRFE